MQQPQRHSNKLSNLKLTEDEKELAQSFFYEAEGFKIVKKILYAIIEQKEKAALSRYVSLKDEAAKSDFLMDKLELQGMQKLLKEFEALK